MDLTEKLHISVTELLMSTNDNIWFSSLKYSSFEIVNKFTLKI